MGIGRRLGALAVRPSALMRQIGRVEEGRILAHRSLLKDETEIRAGERTEGIVQNLYFRWAKDFLEAGKKRLTGDGATPWIAGIGPSSTVR